MIHVWFWHWVSHTIGADYGLSYGHWGWYNFWSGFGSDLTYIGIAISLLANYRKHNCGVRWCLRVGRHNFDNPNTGLVHLLCRRHHPSHPGKPITAQAIVEIQLEKVAGGV